MFQLHQDTLNKLVEFIKEFPNYRVMVSPYQTRDNVDLGSEGTMFVHPADEAELLEYIEAAKKVLQSKLYNAIL